jgi:phosphatidylglycerophosphate synthase
MATILDLGLLEHFSVIFTMLFVYAIVFGVLQLTKVLGGSKAIDALVALCCAVFLAFSSKPQEVIKMISPWFLILIIFGMFLLMAMRFMFGDEGDEMLVKIMGGKQSAGAWIFVIAIGIMVWAGMSLFGPEVTPNGNSTTTTTSTSIGTSGSTSTPDWKTNVLNTLFHPKVLGTVIVLVIALFAVQLISRVPK